MLPRPSDAAAGRGLWERLRVGTEGREVWGSHHTITPKIPAWAGFGGSTFAPAKAGSDIPGFAKKGEVYTYEEHGFEATKRSWRN
jgi:hypothetical protein